MLPSSNPKWANILHGTVKCFHLQHLMFFVFYCEENLGLWDFLGLLRSVFIYIFFIHVFIEAVHLSEWLRLVSLPPNYQLWDLKQLLNETHVHVCVGESAYLFTIKKFPCVFCIFTRKKKRKQNPQSIHLFCTNYSYLRRTGYTQTPVHVCVFMVFMFMRVPVYQGTAWLFHISSSLCNTKDKAQPNMIAFNVSHKSLSCACVYVWRGGEFPCTLGGTIQTHDTPD